MTTVHGSDRVSLPEHPARGARRVLAGHAVITAAAGIVLIVSPGAIPGAIGVKIPENAFVVCYLLAAAELALSWLSGWGARAVDTVAVRGAVLTCIVFHVATGLLEVVALARGISAMLWLNVAARVVIVVLFAWVVPRDGQAGE